MATLSDTQRVLLSAASQRRDGSILTFPDSIKPGSGLSKSLAALMSRHLAEERKTREALQTIRADGDINYGVFITAAGAAAIGVEPIGSELDAADAAPAASDGDAAAKPPTKATLVLALLKQQPVHLHDPVDPLGIGRCAPGPGSLAAQ